jgi:hypothetical protein
MGCPNQSLIDGLQFDLGNVVGTAVDAAGLIEVDGGIKALWAHKEHLSYFFAKGHLLELRLHLVSISRVTGIVIT